MAKTGTQDRRRLRIGFFVPWITKGRGGTENVGHMMANAMRQRGHEVTIFTFDDAKGPSCWPLDDGIDLLHLPEADDKQADDKMVLAVAAKSLDLLVGLHMNRTFCRYVRCAQKVGVPIVLSEHIDPRFPKWLDVFDPVEREISFAGATLIHLLVEPFRASLHESLHDRIRIVPNTIAPPATMATPGADRSRKSILAVSRLVPRKNVDTLIRAFATLSRAFPDWTLDIVGGGSMTGALKKQIRSLGLGSRVVLHGETSDPYPFFAAADIFAIPSFLEGFPMTVCEAMAHGLPVVGFETCNGVNTQVVHGETGMLADGVDPVASLAGALRPLMDDGDLRKRMGEAGQERYAGNYSNEVVFAMWEDLFYEAFDIGPVAPAPSRDEIVRLKLWEMVWGTAEVDTPVKKAF